MHTYQTSELFLLFYFISCLFTSFQECHSEKSRSVEPSGFKKEFEKYWKHKKSMPKYFVDWNNFRSRTVPNRRKHGELWTQKRIPNWKFPKNIRDICSSIIKDFQKFISAVIPIGIPSGVRKFRRSSTSLKIEKVNWFVWSLCRIMYNTDFFRTCYFQRNEKTKRNRRQTTVTVDHDFKERLLD